MSLKIKKRIASLIIKLMIYIHRLSIPMCFYYGRDEAGNLKLVFGS